VQHDASSLRSNDEILAVKGYLSSVASALLAGPARHARKGRCARFWRHSEHSPQLAAVLPPKPPVHLRHALQHVLPLLRYLL